MVCPWKGNKKRRSAIEHEIDRLCGNQINIYIFLYLLLNKNVIESNA